LDQSLPRHSCTVDPFADRRGPGRSRNFDVDLERRNCGAAIHPHNNVVSSGRRHTGLRRDTRTRPRRRVSSISSWRTLCPPSQTSRRAVRCGRSEHCRRIRRRNERLSVGTPAGSLPSDSAGRHRGVVGRVRIQVLTWGIAQVIASFELAVHGDNLTDHTFDLVFVSAPTVPPTRWVRMLIEPGSGLRFVQFRSLTLAPEQPSGLHP
jgi:hypothetical protein